MGKQPVCHTRWGFFLVFVIFWLAFWNTPPSLAQGPLPETPQPPHAVPAGGQIDGQIADRQINVNWLYGSYVPKDVPLEPLNSDRRIELYLRRTYTAKDIYFKTTLLALKDQWQGIYPEWGTGFDGFSKRLGTRQAQFILQNSVVSLGSGLLGSEPRYDRCHCTGFWPRTSHALLRNFLTYDRTESKLRPDFLPYLGAFAGSVTATTWEPGRPRWQVKGYQAVITQIPLGFATNWLAECAPEINHFLRHGRVH